MKKSTRTNIQLRGAPLALAAKLRARAKKQGKTMSDYALGVLERDLSQPTMEEWLAEVRTWKPIPLKPGTDVAQAIREAREERAEHLARVAAGNARRARR